MAGQRLLEEVRGVMRRLHYSIHTERSYCDWITQFVRFQKMQSREELLAAGAPEIEIFLSYLAAERNVAASTQNQAFNHRNNRVISAVAQLATGNITPFQGWNRCFYTQGVALGWHVTPLRGFECPSAEAQH